MNRQITRLKSAYRSGDRARLIRAARALVEYDRAHPFAMATNPDCVPFVMLARRINRAMERAS